MLTIPKLCGKGCYTMKWWRWELQLCGHLWDQSKDEENPFYCEFLQISLFKLQFIHTLQTFWAGRGMKYALQCLCMLPKHSFLLITGLSSALEEEKIYFVLPVSCSWASDGTEAQSGNFNSGKNWEEKRKSWCRQVLPSPLFEADTSFFIQFH